MFDVQVSGLVTAVEVTFTAVSDRGREVFGQAMGHGCVGFTTSRNEAAGTIIALLNRGLTVVQN